MQVRTGDCHQQLHRRRRFGDVMPKSEVLDDVIVVVGVDVIVVLGPAGTKRNFLLHDAVNEDLNLEENKLTSEQLY